MSEIKVIVVFDKTEKQKYKFGIIEDISRSHLLSLHSVIHLEESVSFYSFLHHVKSLIYIFPRIFYALERIIFSNRNDSEKYRAGLLADVPHLNIPYKRTKNGFAIEDIQLNRISKMYAGIILDLSASSVLLETYCHSEQPVELAEYGIWHLRMSKLSRKHVFLNGFWEIISNQGELSGSLRVTCLGKTTVVYNTHSYLHQYSIYKSLRNHHLKLAAAFIRESESFVNGGYQYRRQVEAESENPAGDISLFLFNFRLVLSYITRFLSNLYSQYFVKTWNIFISKTGPGSGILTINFDKASGLNKPKHTDWADPFVVQHKNKTYLFYEEIQKKIAPKGHLCCAEYGPGDVLMNNQVIISEKFHLSFPFIFNYEGNYYMIPESMGNKAISIYESTEFPYKWKFMKDIFRDVLAADTIVYYHEGYWWLFSTMCGLNMEYNYDDLYLFYSRDLLGSWTPHPMNPVVSDVKTARGAGNIFKMDNKIIRPSQSCRFHYGYGLCLNEIKVLSTKEYKEEVLINYSPEQTPFDSIHTFNFEDGTLFSDAK